MAKLLGQIAVSLSCETLFSNEETHITELHRTVTKVLYIITSIPRIEMTEEWTM
jgi:hypothetical protein